VRGPASPVKAVVRRSCKSKRREPWKFSQTGLFPGPFSRQLRRNYSSPTSRRHATSFQKLGFLTVFTYGEPPFYAHVRRDGALLILRCVEEPVFEGDIRERELLLSAEIGVRTAGEIKHLFAEFQSAGIVFKQTLERQPWGAANFIIKDPDGNLLLFAGPAD
jgi:Glyoxalase/Bleomycin resistance protein/Dioxygenase superfamily